MIKSPLRYPGGKSRAVELIASLLPEFDEFREPFLGGGSVFVHLKQKYPHRQYWVNDLYLELYKFWEQSQANIETLLEQIYKWRHQFRIGKELFRFLNSHLTQFNDLERAAAFFIYNRITFSGTSLSGGFSEGAFQKRFTESSIRRLTPFSEVIQQAKITNYDYKELIQAEGKNVLLFLDPPYYSAAKSALYGKNGHLHKTFNHAEFAEIMRACPHRWLMTYDDVPYVRELFSFANLIPWNLTYGMRNVTEMSDQNGRELFVSNYLTVLPNHQTCMFDFEQQKAV